MASKRSTKRPSQQRASDRAARGQSLAETGAGSSPILPILALLGAMGLAGVAGLLIRSYRAGPAVRIGQEGAVALDDDPEVEGAPEVGIDPAGGLRGEGYSEDLAALCRDLVAGDHPELGRKPLIDLRQRAAELEAQPSDGGGNRDLELAQVYVQASIEMASQGEWEGLFEQFAAGRTLLSASAPLPPALQTRLDELDFIEAVLRLRAGETANCVGGDNPLVCLVDRGPDGVYAEQAHSLAAIELLQADLRRQPDHLAARWLLNLAAMTVGQWPDAVPEAQRIDPAAFAPESPDLPRLVDVARVLGVAPVDMLGGSVMEDLDGDGLLDIFATSYDPCRPAHYFRNAGDGRFEDRSLAAGLGEQLGGFNAQQTDYDNDGDFDLFITRGAWQFDLGRQRNSLLRNDGGGRFVDVTHAAGLAEPAYPTQASAWADYDLDGDLDLYVGNETDQDGKPFPSQLFRNEGDGRFVDVAAQAGVRNDQMAKGLAWGDFDNDGDEDLFVSNIGLNRLYVNQGDGSFVDRAAELGLLEPARSFAAWFWDYDNDGGLDLFVAGYQASVDEVVADYLDQPSEGLRSKLYRNDGKGGFEDVSHEVGVDRVRLPMGANYGDIDNDGWLDFYLGTGEPDLAALFPNVIYHNQAGLRFVDVTGALGLGHLPKGHGVAFGDIDADGDQDLYLQAGGFVPGDASPNALFLNPGVGKHWLTLRLVGRTVNRPAYGARIEVRIVEGGKPRSIHLLVGSGGSFGASSLQQEVGLGEAERIASVIVRWPGLAEPQVFADIGMDRIVELVEGQPEARVIEQAAIRMQP
jgi:hypothetical protein